MRVGVGQEVTNLAFSLTPARMARVSGTLLDATGRPGPGDVMLGFSDRGTLTAFAMARGVAGVDGSFTFRNVPPGAYVLQGFGRNNPPGGNLARAPFGWLPVMVSGEDHTGLVMKVSQGAMARGRIVFDGVAPRTLRPDDVRVFPLPVEFDSAPVGGGPPESVTSADWTFSVANLSGVRATRVDLRSADWSVKRISLNGRDVTDVALDFRKGDIEGLEIVLTNTAPSVSGTVVDQNRQPANNFSVIVFADDADKWRFPSRFIQLARPNQDGRFKASGLPPERYLAIALATVQGMEWQDPEFLEKLRRDAASLTLAEGESLTIELKLAARPD